MAARAGPAVMRAVETAAQAGPGRPAVGRAATRRTPAVAGGRPRPPSRAGRRRGGRRQPWSGPPTPRADRALRRQVVGHQVEELVRTWAVATARPRQAGLMAQRSCRRALSGPVSAAGGLTLSHPSRNLHDVKKVAADGRLAAVRHATLPPPRRRPTSSSRAGRSPSTDTPAGMQPCRAGSSRRAARHLRLESALSELAERLGLAPLVLRLVSHAGRDEQHDRP